MVKMQEPRMPPSGEITNSKPRKKKVTTLNSLRTGHDVQMVQDSLPLRTGQKASKRNFKKEEGSPLFQQSERSNSDSLPDSSTQGDEYRALRRKYLLLEEKSFALGGELKEVEDDVKTLKDEKLALLDQLVVLEGLIHPSEVQSHRSHLP